MRLAVLLCFISYAPIVLAQGAGDQLPGHPCATADATNPVYYEGFSAVWSWAPDGASLVYDRAVGDISQVRVHHLASGSVRCITSGDFHDTQPNWSPAGDRIAFVRQIEGISQIYFLHTADGAVQAVTDSEAGSAYPSFSRDGTMLAYVRFAPGDSRRRFVVVRDLASAEERVVFDSPFGLNDLSWSADNTAVLLFSIDEDGWNDIYTAKADGTGVARLTDNTVTDSYNPEYAPDGSRLLFGQGSEDSVFSRWFNYDLYEKDVATGAVRRMTWAFGSDDRGHYAPDGQTIGFTTYRSGYAEIYLMDADGGNLRAVTKQPDEEWATYVHKHGVAAGQAYFDATRRKDPEAKLISERAAAILTRQLIARGQPEDAVVVARLGVATHPDSWRAWTALGEAFTAAGDREGAREALRRSLAAFPNQVQLIFLLGFEDFFQVLDAIEGLWHDKGSDLLELANWLQRRGDFLSALTLLHRLDEVYPNDADVLSRLARTQMMLGDHAAAVETYGRVLHVDPDREDARFHLGRIQHLERLRR